MFAELQFNISFSR